MKLYIVAIKSDTDSDSADYVEELLRAIREECGDKVSITGLGRRRRTPPSTGADTAGPLKVEAMTGSARERSQFRQEIEKES